MTRGVSFLSVCAWICALLMLFATADRAALGAPSVLADLRAAVDGDDEEAMLAALRGVPGFYAATTDPKVRESLLEALNDLLDKEGFEQAKLATLRALSGIDDTEAVWDVLGGRLPFAGETGASDYEIAVIRALGSHAPPNAANRLLVLATQADDDVVAVESMLALRGYAPNRRLADEIMRDLMTFVSEEAPTAPPAGEDSPPKVSERWANVADATLSALRSLSGRELDLAGFRELWDQIKARDGASFRGYPETLRALADEDPAVVLAALERLFDLRAFGDAVRQAAEKSAADAADWRARATALRILAMQDALGPPPEGVLAHIRAKPWQVRLALAEGLICYQHRAAVEALIRLLGDAKPRVRTGAAKSLTALTGRDIGTSQQRWAKWLRGLEGKIRFVPRKHRMKAPEERGSRYAHEEPANTFFGAKITSRRVVLVLDKSDSMYYGLFDKVIEEVGAFLDGALPTTSFGLVEYDATARLWRSKLTPANATQAETALEWLKRSRPIGATNIIDSMRSAFGVPKVECLALLSDGLPNRGEPCNPPEILAAVRQINRHERLVVHTLLLLRGRRFPHDTPRDEEPPPPNEQEMARRRRLRASAGSGRLGSFMKALAEQNDGTFNVVFADFYAPDPDSKFRPNTDK